jgi:hypothetical protein
MGPVGGPTRGRSGYAGAMKNLIRRLAAAAVILALSACAMWAGPRSVVYSEADLNQMLARRFPLDKRVLDVLDLTLSQPQLSLQPDSNRLRTAFDLGANDRLFGHAWKGRIDVAYGLRLERSDNSLRIAQPRVLAFSLDRDATARPQVPAERIAALIVEKLLDDAVLHRLKPEQVERMAQAGYELGEVRVGRSGVEITAVPRH